MLIHRFLPGLTALLLAGSGALAGSEIPQQGDTYIISRDGADMFRGSHRIYDRMAEGLVEVTYCGRSYWVRYATIAWTQLEVEQDNVVRVEHNWGKGWRPICDHPEEQVTLKDLGVHEDPRMVVYNDGTTTEKVSRFAAIRDYLGAFGRESAAKSYHDE